MNEIEDLYEPIKKIKKKKIKNKMKKSNPRGTFVKKNTQKIVENIIDKNKKNEVLNKKKKYMISEKSTNNTDIIKNKIEEDEDTSVNEFNLEDDDVTLNISINNINKTFNLLDYITSRTEPVEKISSFA